MLKVDSLLSSDSPRGSPALTRHASARASSLTSPITRTILNFPPQEEAAAAPSRESSRSLTRERRVTSFMSRREREGIVSAAQTKHLMLSNGVGASIKILDEARLKDVGIKVKGEAANIQECQSIELALRWKADGGKTRLSFDPSLLKRISDTEFQFTLASVVQVTLRTVDASLSNVEAQLDMVTDLAQERFKFRREGLAESSGRQASSALRRAS